MTSSQLEIIGLIFNIVGALIVIRDLYILKLKRSIKKADEIVKTIDLIMALQIIFPIIKKNIKKDFLKWLIENKHIKISEKDKAKIDDIAEKIQIKELDFGKRNIFSDFFKLGHILSIVSIRDTIRSIRNILIYIKNNSLKIGAIFLVVGFTLQIFAKLNFP